MVTRKKKPGSTPRRQRTSPPAVDPPGAGDPFFGALNGRVLKNLTTAALDPSCSGPLMVNLTFTDGSALSIVTEQPMNARWTTVGSLANGVWQTFAPFPSTRGR